MNTIYITKNDHKKLAELIEEKRHRDDNDAALLAELERAEIVEPQDIPTDVITMNSLAEFSDTESKDSLEYRLVLPHEADISQRKISVLSPIGRAILGCRIGDTCPVHTPKGERKLKVEKIIHQPESHGNYE